MQHCRKACPEDLIQIVQDLALRDRFPLDGRQAGLLVRHAELVVEWSNRVRLVGRPDWKWIIEAQTIPSLLVARALADTERAVGKIVDIGSGAGFPAIPTAVVGDCRRHVLVESVRKKALFLVHTAKVLSLRNVEVTNHRIEESSVGLGPDAFVTARGVGPISRILSMLGRRAVPGLRIGVYVSLVAPSVGGAHDGCALIASIASEVTPVELRIYEVTVPPRLP